MTDAPAASVEQLQAALRRALARPEYRWHRPPKPLPARHGFWGWPGRALAALGRWLDKIFHWLVLWLDRLIRFLFHRGAAKKLPSLSVAGRGWIIWPLLFLLLALAVWFLLRHARGRSAAISAPPITAATMEDALAGEPTRHPPEAWLRLCHELQAKGETRLALRSAFLALLALLAARRWLRLHAGRSNHDYLVELAENERRRNSRLGLAALVAKQIEVFNRVWYGGQPVSDELLAGFLAGFKILEERVDAAQS